MPVIFSRRPPRREWLPVLVGLVLGAVGVALLAGGDREWGRALLVPGLVLFFGTVAYRMVTATADD